MMNADTADATDTTVSASSPKPSGKNYPDKMVTEEEVHSAMDYLRNSAFDIGKVVKETRYAENWIKHIEALEYKKSAGTNDNMRKADARTSDRYVAAITEDAIAAGERAKLYALREAAAAVIDVYRTQSATIRAATKL